MSDKTGILVINLGTPDSYNPSDVRKYLNQFLTDGRVIDIPFLWRQLLVRGIIVPLRYRKVAKKYQEIWLEQGSPLKVYSQDLADKLQVLLGEEYVVELAMCVQHPSVKSAMERLRKQQVARIVIFPMYPQYASSTVGSAYESVLSEIKTWLTIPELKLVKPYYDHPAFIGAWIERAKNYVLKDYDHILFSYHGLPVRHLKNAYPGNNHCYSSTGCCEKITAENRYCYKAQCLATTKFLVKELGLLPDQYSTCFQSRLGRDEWIQPYLTDVMDKLAGEGKKKILVFSPAFVADCLETIHEIAIESLEEFQKAGGEKLDLVASLNTEDYWIAAVKQILLTSA